MVNSLSPGGISPTARQLRAARAGLDLSITALAKEAGLGVNTVARAEKGGAKSLIPANAGLLKATLERLGVTFLADDGHGPGVRFAST